MSDLQDVISRLERVIQTGATDKDGKHPISAEFVLEELKSIADRPQGEWIKRHGTINCSVCKRSNWSACFEDTVRSFNFCPNCGARMKGADDE